MLDRGDKEGVGAKDESTMEWSDSIGIAEMSCHRHLRNAPIMEALLDIRVISRPGFRAEEFRQLREQMAAKYPSMEEQRGFQTEFGVKDGKPVPPTQTELGLTGVFFWTQDRLNAAQFRTDGFTFNRLRPYTSWEMIFPEAMRMWGLYTAVARPERVIRVALRSINRMIIPMPTGELSDYLAAPPGLPPDLDLKLGGFLTAVTLEDPQGGTAANVTTALEPPSGEGVPLILDIDAYKTVAMDPQDPEVQETFQALRVLKNDVFFGSLTENLTRAYE